MIGASHPYLSAPPKKSQARGYEKQKRMNRDKTHQPRQPSTLISPFSGQHPFIRIAAATEGKGPGRCV